MKTLLAPSFVSLSSFSMRIVLLVICAFSAGAFLCPTPRIVSPNPSQKRVTSFRLFSSSDDESIGKVSKAVATFGLSLGLFLSPVVARDSFETMDFSLPSYGSR